MGLPFFSNTCTVRNTMGGVRMNSAIQTFQRFTIQGENGGVCTVTDLKNLGTVLEAVTGRMQRAQRRLLNMECRATMLVMILG